MKFVKRHDVYDIYKLTALAQVHIGHITVDSRHKTVKLNIAEESLNVGLDVDELSALSDFMDARFEELVASEAEKDV